MYFFSVCSLIFLVLYFYEIVDVFVDDLATNPSTLFMIICDFDNFLEACWGNVFVGDFALLSRRRRESGPGKT